MDDKTTQTPLTAIDWSAELESQFGITSAPATELDVQSVSTDPAGEGMIAGLRDRLAYYEHFDSLIKDNIARSAELSQLRLLPDDGEHSLALFPEGRLDQDLQQVDLRGRNSWRLLLD